MTNEQGHERTPELEQVLRKLSGKRIQFFRQDFTLEDQRSKHEVGTEWYIEHEGMHYTLRRIDEDRLPSLLEGILSHVFIESEGIRDPSKVAIEGVILTVDQVTLGALQDGRVYEIT